MKKRIYEKGKEYISVSQYSAAKSCQMKWYLKNVAYVKYAQSAGSELGSHWHTLIEDFIAGKDIEPNLVKSPTFRKVFEKNGWFFDFLSLLKNVKVEKSIDYELESGAICIGDVDLVVPDTQILIENGKPVKVSQRLGFTTIIDWKTMSSWNYALDSEKLSRDDQILLYGKSEKETKEVMHVQINHRESAVRFVSAPFDYDKSIMVEANINAMAIEMSAMRKQDILFIKKNRNSCAAYGGCPNLPYCNGKETIEELKERVKPKEALSNEAEVSERLQGLRKELGKEIKIEPIFVKEKKMNFTELLAAKKANAALEANKQLVTNVKPVDVPAAPITPEAKKEIEAAVAEVEKKVKKEKKVKVDLPVADLGTVTVEMEMPKESVKVIKQAPKVMATIVCINCQPNNNDFVQPCELFKEDIDSILKANNIKCLAESKYGEAAKLLFKIQDQIKDSLASKTFVFIDTKRIADNTVLEMLYGDDRFILIGGKW